MNNGLFQYALIPISEAKKDATWLIEDNHENYISMDILDIPENILDQVFTLYTLSYQQYKKKLITTPTGLFKYNRWILFYDDEDQTKKIVAFSLFKTTDFGIKTGLTGSDGSKLGKKSIILFKISSFNSSSVFGEISGRLKDLIVKDIPVVKFQDAKVILEHFGKTDIVHKKNNYYTREIKSLGIVKKIMVGLPKFRPK